MTTPKRYYRIYSVVGGGLFKRSLLLPRDKYPSMRAVSPNHQIDNIDDAIGLLQDALSMKGNICMQYAIAELGTESSGKIVAITNSDKDIVKIH